MPLSDKRFLDLPKGAPAPFGFTGGGIRGSGPALVWLVPMLVALLFVPGLSGDFVFDDAPNIARHPAFAQPIDSLQALWEAMLSSGASSIGRPLSVLSFLANFQLTGLDPFWFKLTNLVIHALNGALLGLLLGRLFRFPAWEALLAPARVAPGALALTVAAAWTGLAIHTTAVLLIVQRMEMLAQSVVLLALVLYLGGRWRMIAGERGGRWRVVAALLLLPPVGILAKESAILIPAYAFLLEVYLLRFAAASRRDGHILAGLYGLLALCAAVVAWKWLLPYALNSAEWQTRNFDLVDRLLSEARILWLYARWVILPDLGAMSLYHDAFVVSRSWTNPPTTLPAVVAIAAVLGLLLALARRRSMLGLGISWYLAAHLLTATIVPLELVFEHRNYFAAIGVLLVLAYPALRLMARGPGAQRLVLLLVAAFILAQGAGVAWRALEWSNPLTHAQAEAARNPGSPRAQYELGRVLYMMSGQDPEHPAFALAIRQFETAARTQGASALPLQALLIAESQAGQEVAAARWEQLDAFLRSHPLDRQTQTALLSLVECAGEGHCRFPPERMVQVLGLAASKEPPDPELLTAYGSYALTRLRDLGLATGLFADAVRADPGNPLRRSSYGQFLAIVGRYEEAYAEADTMDRLDRWYRYRSKSAALRQFIGELKRQRDAASTAPASVEPGAAPGH